MADEITVSSTPDTWPAATAGTRVIISGASGLVGSALKRHLAGLDYRVEALVRHRPLPGSGEIYWDLQRGYIDRPGLEGAQAVVHLAGENVAAGRWTAARKQAIRDSRVRGTRLLCEALAALKRPPDVLVCASAVGYYGHRGDEQVDEDSPPGSGFLAEVCRAWESAADPARGVCRRVVHLRIGIVLSTAGGALAKMLTPFRMGMGGPVGSGGQYMSWIALDDLIAAMEHLIWRSRLTGPVNAVAPRPVTNREFVRILGQVLHRPAVVPLPATAVRLMFGEMGEALLLEGARVIPARLLADGFVFRYPELESALRHLLGSPANR